MEGSLRQLAPFIHTLKAVLGSYGLGVDDALRSVRGELLSVEGDNALVRLHYDLAGREMILQLPLSRREGHWYLTRTLADTDALLRKADAARAAASPSPAEALLVGKQQRRRLSHNGADVETEPAAVSGEESQSTPADTVPASLDRHRPEPGTAARARASGRRRPLWARLLGRLVEPWLSLKIEPEDPGQYNDGRPVVYVLEDYGLSNALILDKACRQAGPPRRWCRWPVTRPGASAPTWRCRGAAPATR